MIKNWMKLNWHNDTFVTLHGKTYANGLPLNGWKGRASEQVALQTAHSPVRTGSSNGWTGYEVFRNANTNGWTAYSPVRTGSSNNWTGYKVFRTANTNGWTAYSPVRTGRHKRVNRFPITLFRRAHEEQWCPVIILNWMDKSGPI